MDKVLSILKQKKVWLPLVLVLMIGSGLGYQSSQNGKTKYTTEVVRKHDLQQTVSATGTVEAAEDIQLNFRTIGRLAKVSVKVGDIVVAGQSLASLDTREAEGALLSATANLKSAEASFAKIRAGAASQDVAVYESAVKTAETALVNIRASQVQAVANALAQLLGLAPTALPATSNISTATLAVSGTYVGTLPGTYTLRAESSATLSYSVAGLEAVGISEGSRTTPTSLGSRGLKVQWSSSGTVVAGDAWTIEIPNRSNSSYAGLEAAYQAARTTEKQLVEAAERALADAQAKLTQVQAPPRSYDIQAAEAAVESARAAVWRAEVDLADRTITAPTKGTITKVGNQVSETTSLAVPVFVLLAAGNNEVKVQVPESDIAKLKVGQVVDMTLDAFGSNDHFAGRISFTDPASTVIQDVVYYEVTVLFDGVDDRIKPGMTANIDVVSAEAKDVLVVPLRAVKYDEARQSYVELMDTDGELVRANVSLGLKGDDGLVEVLSGLKAEDSVVTFKQNGTP